MGGETLWRAGAVLLVAVIQPTISICDRVFCA